jgi:hypothetical protein
LKLKFLTDAQTNFKLVGILRKLEWDVETVYEHKLGTEKNDANILAYAHSIGRVFLTFDKLRKDVWIEITAELVTNGGKLIVIGGGPEQPPERAVGKLLFFQEVWLPFLEGEDGRARIRDIKQTCTLTRASEMRTSKEISRVPNFDEYLRRREVARKTPVKRKPRRKRDHLTQSLDLGS